MNKKKMPTPPQTIKQKTQISPGLERKYANIKYLPRGKFLLELWGATFIPD